MNWQLIVDSLDFGIKGHSPINRSIGYRTMGLQSYSLNMITDDTKEMVGFACILFTYLFVYMYLFIYLAWRLV